jgi:hypothetical protein
LREAFLLCVHIDLVHCSKPRSDSWEVTRVMPGVVYGAIGMCVVMRAAGTRWPAAQSRFHDGPVLCVTKKGYLCASLTSVVK